MANERRRREGFPPIVPIPIDWEKTDCYDCIFDAVEMKQNALTINYLHLNRAVLCMVRHVRTE